MLPAAKGLFITIAFIISLFEFITNITTTTATTTTTTTTGSSGSNNSNNNNNSSSISSRSSSCISDSCRRETIVHLGTGDKSIYTNITCTNSTCTNSNGINYINDVLVIEINYCAN